MKFNVSMTPPTMNLNASMNFTAASGRRSSNRPSFKEAIENYYGKLSKHYEHLSLSQRRDLGFTDDGCFEISTDGLGEFVEFAIIQYAGITFSLKFCWKDTYDMRCVKNGADGDRNQDETYFDPNLNALTPSASARGGETATIPGSDASVVGGDLNFPEDGKDGHVGWISATDNGDSTIAGLGSDSLEDRFSCDNPDYPKKSCDSSITKFSSCRCYRCRDQGTYTPSYVPVDGRAGLIELEFEKVPKSDKAFLEDLEADCPDVSGSIKLRADTVKDGDFNWWFLSDTDFLMEGCIRQDYNIENCIGKYVFPAAGPVIQGIKKAASAFGAQITFGALFVETCIFLKTLGFEDGKCEGRNEGRKYMPLNPGLRGKGGYEMVNSIKEIKYKRVCRDHTTWYAKNVWREKCGCCCWGKCWGCWDTSWEPHHWQVRLSRLRSHFYFLANTGGH